MLTRIFLQGDQLSLFCLPCYAFIFNTPVTLSNASGKAVDSSVGTGRGRDLQKCFLVCIIYEFRGGICYLPSEWGVSIW